MSHWSSPAWVLALAFLLDASLGEPPASLHPVVWIGKLIAPLKRVPRQKPQSELAIGGLYTFAVTSGVALFGWALLYALRTLPVIAFALEVYLLWCCFALKGLLVAGEEMLQALQEHDLPRARRALGSLCSRDPSALSEAELAGATIESLSENASDSLVAPLFYFALFGLPGALFYRAANTLDAMVGYRGRFEYLGKVAARLDDLLNLIPARLTALLLLIAGAALRMPVRRAVDVLRRDHAATESPNAGWPMSAAAGLLGVQLDKRDAYVLGAGLREPEAFALRRGLRLLMLAGALASIAFVAVLFVVRFVRG